MGVRVWGVMGDLLVEIVVEPGRAEPGLRIDGLPRGRDRTTSDRVRAALINAGLVTEAPALRMSLRPALRRGRTSELDAALAFAVLAHAGWLGPDVGWVLAIERAGLDGTIRRSPDEIVELGTAAATVRGAP